MVFRVPWRFVVTIAGWGFTMPRKSRVNLSDSASMREFMRARMNRGKGKDLNPLPRSGEIMPTRFSKKGE